MPRVAAHAGGVGDLDRDHAGVDIDAVDSHARTEGNDDDDLPRVAGDGGGVAGQARAAEAARTAGDE